jgi:hypothetical protein
MFALRVNLSYQHIKMGVASLSREARPFVLRVILTINKSQIKMGVASLSREAAYPEIMGSLLICISKMAVSSSQKFLQRFLIEIFCSGCVHFYFSEVKYLTLHR